MSASLPNFKENKLLFGFDVAGLESGDRMSARTQLTQTTRVSPVMIA